MAKRRTTEYILENSPFFNKEEIRTKSRMVPLEYNKEEDYYLTKRIIHKSEEFVKQVIEREINITAYHKLGNLSKTILFYVTQTSLEYNSLTFMLDAKILAKILGISSIRLIYKSINELIDTKYIARTESKERYWINHNRYYKGNYLIIKSIES